MKRKIALLLLIAMLSLVLSGCRVEGMGTLAVYSPDGFDFETAADKISAVYGKTVEVELLEFIGKEKTQALLDDAEHGIFNDATWLHATGYSYLANLDFKNGVVGSEYIRDFGYNGKDTFDVSFAGDVLYDPDFSPMGHANQKGGVLECIDAEVVDYLRASDVLLINNEFSVGTRGEPLSGKTWTFQASPESLQIHKDLGADIVSLANNHVYDYGKIGFYDTLAHLEEAGIPYVGAGKDLDEARQAQYFIVNGVKIGIIAASRAEKVYFTPVATEESGGIMGTYESTDFLEAIKEADAQCDILIVNVHWGTENSVKLETAQKTMAREYIDAGADAVIGGHTHCVQGMEFYNGKPIAYSIGNFWFSSYTLDSCVVTLRIDGNMNVETRFLPLIQEGCETHLLEGEERRAYLDKVEGFEPQAVRISDDGLVTPIE
ncbi:MAG: CapA family protein [Clostridia bacterium]|nr:CapA family protein [Clostridia bacterium]